MALSIKSFVFFNILSLFTSLLICISSKEMKLIAVCLFRETKQIINIVYLYDGFSSPGSNVGVCQWD